MAKKKQPDFGSVLVDGQEISYQIDRGNRKHYYIYIAEGKVIVKGPPRADSHLIEEMVRNKSQWIFLKLSQQKQQKKPELTPGSALYFAGESFRLEVTEGQGRTAKITKEHGILLVELPTNIVTSKNTLQCILEDYYRVFTENMVQDALKRLSVLTGLSPSKITVKKLRSSWGRCSSNGNISISLYLGAYPQKVVDYVVLHELCHLRQMNHSFAFWKEVERYMPDWKQQREALKSPLSIKI